MAGNGDSACGNGVIDGSEECDDKNAEALDGCSACAIDPFYMCRTSWRHPDTPNHRGFMVWIFLDISSCRMHLSTCSNNTCVSAAMAGVLSLPACVFGKCQAFLEAIKIERDPVRS